jgi:hypothetical protein
MWHASVPTIQRWLQATNLTERVTHPSVPPSWHDVAPTKNKTELATHYCVSMKTVNKWIAETGIKAKPKKRLFLSRPEQRERTKLKCAGSEDCAAAADYLRRIYSNVHRCDIYLTTQRTWGQVLGLPNKGRGQYFVHSVGVITNDQLLTLARKHGFQS